MATQPSFQLVQAAQQASTRRVARRPQHKFNLGTKPYQIVPFMCAPVIPGETLQNLLLQSRVVTDPILNRLVGWHKEYYFFYVPHVSMTLWDPDGLLRAMMLDPSVDVSSLRNAASPPEYYTFAGGMNFVYGCLLQVVKEFFRDEDEPVPQPMMGAYPIAQIDQQQWYQSAKLESAGEDDDSLPGAEEIIETEILPSMSTAYAQWELMRDSGMVDLDYDDFIRSYGVDVPKSEEIENRHETTFRPELIRFARSWAYPSNTIDPSDGSATSAVSWSIAERADKKRFFKYPGFIFGVTVTRPKIYLGNQKGAAVGFLDSAYTWLPAVLHSHVYSSIREIQDSATTGIFQNQTEDYWFDCRDLFLYGDQFVNYVMDWINTGKVALPDAALNLKYPTEAMVDALFTTPATANQIREDGVCHLNILSKLTDTTP